MLSPAPPEPPDPPEPLHLVRRLVVMALLLALVAGAWQLATG